MRPNKKELIEASKTLYNEIDECIGNLVKARLDKNTNAEGMALFKMEGLMVGTLQHLSCIIDSEEDSD